MAEKKTAAPAQEQAIDLNEVQKQIAEMLNAAKAEAKKIVDEAKAVADEITAPAKEKAALDAERQPTRPIWKSL